MKQDSRLARLLEKYPKLRLLYQFIKFGIVGVSNTLLSLAVTYATMAVFKFGFSIDTTWSLNVCTTLGYIAGVCNSYFWNKRYVFKNAKEKNGKKAFLKTFICYGVTYLLSMLLMDVCVVYLSIPNWIAPIPRLVITIPLNFIANKLWAFKDSQSI
jgi:putative flippase GtrA